MSFPSVPPHVLALSALVVVGMAGCSHEAPEGFATLSVAEAYTMEVKNQAIRALAQMERNPAGAKRAADEYVSLMGELSEEQSPPETEHTATIKKLTDGIRQLGSQSDAKAIRAKAQELRKIADSLPGDVYLDYEEGGPRPQSHDIDGE